MTYDKLTNTDVTDTLMYRNEVRRILRNSYLSNKYIFNANGYIKIGAQFINLA